LREREQVRLRDGGIEIRREEKRLRDRGREEKRLRGRERGEEKKIEREKRKGD
jgi:hypothetical protein